MSGARDRAVFLARATYRQRRLRDALRVLPIFGVILWLFPLLWQGTGGTATALQFVFGVWVFLIVLAAFLALRLKPDTLDETPEDRD